MMNLILKSLLMVILLLVPSLMRAGTPVIRANGNQGNVVVAVSDSVAISISMVDAVTDPIADWWIAVTTPLPAPDNLYFFNRSAWTTESQVAYQQPFSNIDSLEILNTTSMPIGIYNFYFGVDLNPNGELDMNSLVYALVEVAVLSVVEPTSGSCGETTNVFSVAPLESDAFFQIDPLGATNPSAHTFPTVHTYMMLSDNSVSRNVFAPGDITLTQVNLVENLSKGGTDYSLNFTSCTEITGYFDHLSSINSEISDQLAAFDNCNQYFAGPDEYRFCSQPTSIEITTGYNLGTVGGPGSQGSAALDFGLRDTRITPLHYTNPARVVASDQVFVVCPYDYFEPGSAKTVLFDKLGNARSDPPVCGTVEHDVDDTLQGRWYLKGTNDFSENDHIALVPSNTAPVTTGVLSIGNSDVGTAAFFFDYRDSGLINRRFSEVSQFDTIYCWDSLRNRTGTIASGSAQALSGIIYVKLIDEINLVMERSTQFSSCPANVSTLNFTGNVVDFVR